ncbi:hypothetical protein ACPOL_3365 [Acidisarcina polymorpha]|uniref:Uncharacterized protein n=1 Tax=Acidisarcina polymorpha TaxID=2211140 RepID=A0A2Z5G1H6_9BACT|nr:hypothetical protein ACPOL_3365 [Acidisarcina polymorpha]
MLSGAQPPPSQPLHVIIDGARPTRLLRSIFTGGFLSKLER